MSQKIGKDRLEGVIVEEITNANGTAVKYETGLMICTQRADYVVDSAEWIVRGSLYNQANIVKTFPESFNAAPSVVCLIEGTVIWTNINAVTTTNFRPVIWSYTNTGNFTIPLNYVAIGRWK